MTLACQSNLSGKRSHLDPIHSTYHGSLRFRLSIEVVYESPHVYLIYEAIDIKIPEAAEHHKWNPKHSDCNASHEGRLFKISIPLTQ